MGSSGSRYDMTGNAGDEIATDIKTNGSVKRKKEKSSMNESKTSTSVQNDSGTVENSQANNEEPTVTSTEDNSTEHISNGTSHTENQEEAIDSSEAKNGATVCGEVQNETESELESDRN